MKTDVRCLAAVLLGALCSPLLAQDTITQIDPGAVGVQATAISSSGLVVGSFEGGTDFDAFVDNQGVVTDLNPLLGSYGSGAYGVNSAGVVVGSTITDQGFSTAFVYTPGVGITYPLGAPTPVDLQNAVGVNASSTVVGIDNSTVFQSSSAGTTSLSTIQRVSSLNDSGTIAGATLSSGQLEAATTNGSSATLLGFLPGTTSSIALAISNDGIVAGDSGSDAFIYQNGTMTNLGLLAGYDSATVTGVNDDGIVVGYDSMTNGNGRAAFVYIDGDLINLNTLSAIYGTGIQLTEATGINDSDQIIAQGALNGVDGAWVIDANNFNVPEGGSTLALVLAGMAGLACLSRTRRRAIA